MLLMLIAGCAGMPVEPDPTDPTVEPPTAPAPQPAAPTRFTCENAAEALSRPSWSVYACAALPGVTGLYAMTLESPEGAREGRLVPVGADGLVVSDTGMAAAGAWMREQGLLDNPAALTLQGLTNALEAFGGWPEPFDMQARDFDVPDVGASSFTADPFRLTLYMMRDHRTDGGPEVYIRAALEQDDAGKLVWRPAQLDGGGWTEGPVMPAE